MSIIESNSTRNSFQSPDSLYITPQITSGSILSDVYSAGLDKCIRTRLHVYRMYFQPWKVLCAPSVYPSAFTSPHHLETTDLLNVTTVFVFWVFFFAQYPIVGPTVIYTALSVWLISLRNMHSHFLHVFSWLDSFFFFYRWIILLCLDEPKFIHPMMDLSVAKESFLEKPVISWSLQFLIKIHTEFLKYTFSILW